MIDENQAHEVGGDTEKMRAAGPVLILDGDESEIGFVEKRGWLESVVGAFAPQVTRSEPSKFGVDERHQMIQGRLIASLPLVEQSGDRRP